MRPDTGSLFWVSVWAAHTSMTALQKAYLGLRESCALTDHGESPEAGAGVLGRGGRRMGWADDRPCKV